MPRPKRTRRTRAAARAERDVTPPPNTEPDAIPSTPLKPTEAAQPDSSEKENRPEDAVRSRVSAGSLRRRGHALRDSTMRQSLSREPESDEDDAIDVDSRELSDPPDVEMSRRETATPLMRRDVSGLDVDEEIFSDMYSELEPPSTRGRSANTSTLSVGQFKRRSRAPSVVSRDGGPIRPSSRGQNTPSVSSTFNFGQFKRRAREPSILGRNRRAQKETQTTDQSASESELDGEDFAPDAVSTPLNRRRSQRATSAARAPQPPSSGLRSRKRKSGEIEHEASDRPEKTARAERETEEPEEEEQGQAQGQATQQGLGREPTENPANSDEDVDSDDSLTDVSSLPSPLSATAAYNERPVTPINATMEEIMAPPASSSSDDTEWPSIRKLASRRRRAATPTTPLHPRNDDDILSDISSPPSLTHSPNLPARRRGAGRARGRNPTRDPTPEPLTSDLASLLPKRRSKRSRRDDDDAGSEDEDVEGSTLGSDDEDELARSRSTRRRGGSHSRGRGASARPPSRQASRAEHQAAAARRAEQAGSEANRRVTRTYGARPSNPDDSFAPLPDDSFTSSGLVIDDPKEELKRATHKFKEVDKWELEFEEVAENQSSSDPDAR